MPRALNISAVMLPLALSLVLPGCGRKSAPQPPLLRKAAPTRDLSVIQEGITAVIRWSYPSLTTAGGPLPDVEYVEVWRTTLPLGLEPKSALDQQLELRSQLIASHGKLLLSLDPTALEQATRGPQLEVRDDLKAWYEQNKERMPLVIWYTVRTACCQEQLSRWSNIARLEPRLPPPPPQGLVLQTKAECILVTWEPPEAVATIVERSSDQQQWRAVTPQPTTDASFCDRGARQGSTWYYRLRAVHVTGQKGMVIGDPGRVVGIDYPDIYALGPVPRLVCLPEGDAVRLRWDRVAGAAGYRIFRHREGESWRQLGLVTGREYQDLRPPIGNLEYAVKTVDDAGNDSEPLTCTTVMGH